MSKRTEEIIKEELAKQIEVMQNAKKRALGEWLAVEEATLTLLRATRFILEKLDKMESECRPSDAWRQ